MAEKRCTHCKKQPGQPDGLTGATIKHANFVVFLDRPSLLKCFLLPLLAFSSALSYGVKQQTGKLPSQHALTYVKKHNPERKKDTCISFIEKTNSEICEMLKKKMSSTRNKIINIKKNDKSLKELSLSSQSSINKKSKIKYLD